MNYYEELGLKQTATIQEIRQAYRVLARLVHPDGQAHDPVRDMAERQMKRLNEILSTLTNQQTRREYDARLDGLPVGNGGLAAVPLRQAAQVPAVPRPPEWRRANARWVGLPEWLQPVAEYWFWIALSMVVAAVAIWYTTQAGAPDGMPAAANQAEARVPAIEQRDLTAAEKTATGRHRASSSLPVISQEPAAPARSEPASVAEQPQTPPPEVPQRPDREEPRAAPLAVAPDPPPAPSAAIAPAAGTHGSPFSGNWLYVPDPNEKGAPGVYPPTYVELLMGEDHGRLRGTYRAEYKVVDRAVSPEVTFQIEGAAPAGELARFHWSAADGAKGDAELTLSGANVMKVTWWTTEFGRHSKLASGTSRLIRQQVR